MSSREQIREKLKEKVIGISYSDNARFHPDGYVDKLLELIDSYSEAEKQEADRLARVDELGVLGEVEFEEVPMDIIQYVAKRKAELTAKKDTGKL